MMMRLLSNSICLGLLTTLTGALALLQPARAAQEQTSLPAVGTDLLLPTDTGLVAPLDRLAQASDDSEFAVRLLAAARHLWSTTGAAAPGRMRDDVATLTRTLESTLGAALYAATQRAGTAASPEELLREARA